MARPVRRPVDIREPGAATRRQCWHETVQDMFICMSLLQLVLHLHDCAAAIGVLRVLLGVMQQFKTFVQDLVLSCFSWSHAYTLCCVLKWGPQEKGA